MRKELILPLFLICFLLFLSCKKESADVKYDIKGVQNLVINRCETKEMAVSIVQTQGTAEQVTLSLEGMPSGAVAAIETQQSLANFTTPISFIISDSTKMGDYVVTLSATSASCIQTVTFKLSVQDQLSMILKVYDGTQWTSDLPAGESAPGAKVKLYKDEPSLLMKTPAYTVITDSIGKAYFYHVVEGDYLFTVEKGDLSNIVGKSDINGVLKGFVTTGIFQTKSEIISSAQPQALIGQLRYRDLNTDNKINDADRTMYDRVMVYKSMVTEKIIWIGK
jgi:hypothetical protein